MISVLDAVLRLYIWLIIIRVVLSWVGVRRGNSLFRPVFLLTDPVLEPLSRALPPLGGVIDLSPVLAIFIVWVIRNLLAGAG